MQAQNMLTLSQTASRKQSARPERPLRGVPVMVCLYTGGDAGATE